MSRSTRLGAGMVLLLAGAGVLAWLNLNTQPTPEPTTTSIDHIPDRFVEVLVETPQTESEPELVPAQQTQPQVAAEKAKEGRDLAENAGILSALSSDGSLDGTFGEAGGAGIGGLIGSKGVQVGAGGLGSRGSGLGGGGTAAGLGGLGTSGRGAGSSGYGRGAGVYGSLSVQTPRPDVVSSEQYTNYGINNVTLTSEDAQSTFSVDVDTASYTITRRKLRAGSLPPEAAVRVEEFVNYFDYSYQPPAAGAEQPFSVFMEAAPSPWASDRHILRVGLQGRALDEENRRPARLTFLVDVSGSMGAMDKLPLAQKAMRELVGNLGPEDSVAIATYAGRTEQILTPTPATRKGDIYDAIDKLTSGGGTAMSSGVTMAYDMASAAYVAGAENRVIVLSDGDANIGPDSHQQLLSQISGHAKAGITLSTIGFGMGNYKDTMMEQLANKGDGNNFYIDSFAEAQRVFGEDLSGTLQTIARDVK
ncbi:MAG: Ca-activated chloride channel family protein, partial [Myxococcota bacterium]